MSRPRETRRGGSGCGFVIVTCLVACGFLLINGVMVMSFYRWYSSFGPDFLKEDAVAQGILFIGPILLMFFEWWLVDFIVDLIMPNRHKEAPNDK